jgi:enoyl-[acyl-carrier protein] reductase III
MNIFIAGASKGIGRSIALHFARPGNTVFVNHAHDLASATSTCEAIEAQGARAVRVPQDIGSAAGARAALGVAAEHCERIDLLVDCAVVALPGKLLEIDLDAFDAALAVNGGSLLYLVRAALSLLQPGASVIFLSSRGGRIVVPNYAAIGVGKAMAESLMRYLAVELAPRGVRINTVAPGIVDTEAVRTIFGAAAPDLVAAAGRDNPSGRGIEPLDYCSMIEHLASPAARMVQGQVIFINGGANLAA